MPPRNRANEGDDKPKAAAASKTPVLPWQRVPITIEQGTGVSLEHVHGLAPELAMAVRHSEWLFTHARGGFPVIRCKEQIAWHDESDLHRKPPELGFKELFPVQSSVWRELAGGLSCAHDLCIAAPTGSGKTLAYALPVVNALAG